VFTTTAFRWGEKIAQTARLDLRVNIGAAVMGLGYIVGLRYAAIIAAGSLLSWWVLIPAVSYIGSGLPEILGSSADKLISEMTPFEIFANYVRHIGIGGIAMAGILGVLKSWRIIVGAFRLVLGEIGGDGKLGGGDAAERTQRDMSMKWVATFITLTLIVCLVFFWQGVVHNLGWALMALGIVAIIAFLFTTVAARAIAIVGTNPVSGMTLMTLIISSFFLTLIGLEGELGIVAALLIGGVVCTALSTSGAFVTDLKIGYWLGTTPRTQERWKFLGLLFASAAVGAVILLLNETYGFGAGEGRLEAPQASAMAAVIEPLMTGAEAPWILYMAGCFLALVLEMIKVPPLAFALGMYLPLHLNTPILAGGIVAYIVQNRSKDEKLNAKRREKGTLIASGFIAGGAIMGVVSALLLFFGRMTVGDDTWTVVKAMGLEHWATENPASAAISIVAFLALCTIMARSAMRVKPDDPQ
jgi:putative OPT family oligopeptide transporter